MDQLFRRLKNKENGAQLIPVFKKPERRLLSVFMAVLEIIPEYRGFSLKNFGYNSGKTANYKSFMEPVFDLGKEQNGRPDGLLVCSRGNSTWAMFIEAKCGNSHVRSEQMQGYMELAQTLEVNCVLSISNEFVNTPTELTYHVASNRRKGREVFHVSWSFIVAETHLFLENNSELSSVEVGILEELLRYFANKDNGVSTFDQMPTMWPEFVDFSKTMTGFTANTKGVSEVVNAWHQEVRDLGLKLGRACSDRVNLKLPIKCRKDPKERLKSDRDLLTKEYLMRADYQLPGQKRELRILVDLKACSIGCILSFPPPPDKKAKACVTWLTKVLNELENRKLRIIAKWPGRGVDSNTEIEHLLHYPEEFCEDQKEAPTELMLLSAFQDVRKFKSRKQFIAELEKAALSLITLGQERNLI